MKLRVVQKVFALLLLSNAGGQANTIFQANAGQMSAIPLRWSGCLIPAIAFQSGHCFRLVFVKIVLQNIKVGKEAAKQELDDQKQIRPDNRGERRECVKTLEKQR